MACFITSSTLPAGMQGQVYNLQVVPTPIVPPWDWFGVTLNPGSSLPTGLGMTTTGLIYGRPVVSGDFTFTLRLDWSRVRIFPPAVITGHCTQTFHLSIAPIPVEVFPVLTALPPITIPFPCPVYVPCLGDDVYANLTTESPDAPTFLGRWDNPIIPPIGGKTWSTNGCVGTCQSSLSQEEADQCAANQQWLCDQEGGGCSPPCPPVSPRVFFSQPQTYQVACPDGSLSSYTTPAEYVTAGSVEEANRIAASRAQEFARNRRICLSDLSQTLLCSGSDYIGTIDATCVSTPVVFSLVAGALPTGLTLETIAVRQARISGNTTDLGDFNFTLRAQTTNNTVDKSYFLTVLGIVEDTLPDATQNLAYSQALSGNGGTAPYLFEITVGSLPDGLTMNGAGLISGTPSLSATSETFTVVITSSEGISCPKQFTLTVSACALACVAPADIALAGTDAPLSSIFVPPLNLMFGGVSRSSVTSILQRLDLAGLTVAGETVLTGDGIGDGIYHPTNGRLYLAVADLPDWRISIVDPSGPTELTTVVVPHQTIRLCADDVNDVVYVTVQNVGLSWDLYSMDILTNLLTLIDTGAPTGNPFVAYAPDDDSIITNLHNGELTIYDGASLTQKATIPATNYFLCLAYDSETNTLLTNHFNGATYDLVAYRKLAYSINTTADFTTPLIGNTVAIDVTTTNGLIVGTNMLLFDDIALPWEIVSVNSPTNVTVRNLSTPDGIFLAAPIPFTGTGMWQLAGTVAAGNPTSINVFWSEQLHAVVGWSAAQLIVINTNTLAITCTVVTPLSLGQYRPATDANCRACLGIPGGSPVWKVF